MKRRLMGFFFLVLLSFTLWGCKDKEKEEEKEAENTPTCTIAVTSTPTPIVAANPLDGDGRAVVMYGTPVVDGTIDDVWGVAGELKPELVSSDQAKARGTCKLLWDDGSLYVLAIVQDEILNKASSNTYEQDSIEVFVDELGDKATAYGEDDLQFRINYENEQAFDHGDGTRLKSATTPLKDDSDKVIGYVVELSIAFNGAVANEQIMGFDVQINDAGMQGSRLGTVNLFDSTGTGWSDPSVFGDMILTGKEGGETVVSTARLESLITSIENMNLDAYVNKATLDAPIATGKDVLANTASTQEEVDAAVTAIKEAYAALDDGSGFVSVSKLLYNDEITDPFVMFDGTVVKTVAEWDKRAKEISNLYQYYVYGVWRDGSDEEVTYDYANGSLKIHVKRISTGKEVTYTATVSLPDKSKKAPAGGYPVVVGMHAGISESTALANGYATITLNTYEVASDDTKHSGVFYDLYPYGENWQEQTGVLMAWSWGASRVLDALEAGAGAELNISTENTIVTGVSRWGKAAIVCGAFEDRFKMVAPSCSGAGGVALYRYTSEGNTYDFSTKGASSAYTYSQNEPLGSLQSTDEQGWFNNNFLKFDSVMLLPVDQHLLCSMVADKDRYLFIIGSCISEDWVNAPSMWYSYLATQKIYDFLGISDNLAINIHKEGHAVIAEDMQYICDYFNEHVYGIKSKSDLSALKTSVFAEKANWDTAWDTFADNWGK